MDSEIWLWSTIALGVVALALIVLLLMERERKKPLGEEKVEHERSDTWTGLPFSTRRTVTTDMFREARDRLRILDLEREILSYAIRRLYEAKAEGKITEEERDELAAKYKEDMGRIKEEIARGESIVALNELERMQEEFVSLFSERFEELSKRIEDLRTVSGFAPPEPEELMEYEEQEEELEEGAGEEEEEAEAPEQRADEAPVRQKRKVSRPRAPPEPEKTEAEKKVEQIVAEVERVLKRLGQMEVEE